MEESQEISKMHLLVHPGFIHRERYTKDVKPKHHVDEGEFKRLADLYIEKARSLGDDEIMILFAPGTAQGFKADMKSEQILYARVIREIQGVLGRRLITLVDDVGDCDTSAVYGWNKETVWSRIQKVMKMRRFHFSDRVAAEAYGETLNTCVEDIADHVHEAAGLQEPVVVDSSLTDYVIEGGTYHKIYEKHDDRRRAEGDEFMLSRRTRVRFR